MRFSDIPHARGQSRDAAGDAERSSALVVVDEGRKLGYNVATKSSKAQLYRFSKVVFISFNDFEDRLNGPGEDQIFIYFFQIATSISLTDRTIGLI